MVETKVNTLQCFSCQRLLQFPLSENLKGKANDNMISFIGASFISDTQTT